jgi:P4 family phage/plasmid primase-like protien
MALDMAKLEISNQKKDGATIARCPVCALKGNDKKGTNLVVFDNGAYKCARECDSKEIHKIAGEDNKDNYYKVKDWKNMHKKPEVKQEVKQEVKPPRKFNNKEEMERALLIGVKKTLGDNFVRHIDTNFYDYRDKDGKVMGCLIRINLEKKKIKKIEATETTPEQEIVKIVKDKEPRQILAYEDGWIFSNSAYTKENNIVWPLFESFGMPVDVPIWVVEGEKKVMAGLEIGLNCTCKSSASSTDYSPLLGKDKTIIIIPDFDYCEDTGEALDTGEKKAIKFRDTLKKLDSSTNVIILNSIKNIDNDNNIKNSKKYDLYDFIKENQARGVKDSDILLKIEAMNNKDNILYEVDTSNSIVDAIADIEFEIKEDSINNNDFDDDVIAMYTELWENDVKRDDALKLVCDKFNGKVIFKKLKSLRQKVYRNATSKTYKAESDRVNGHLGGKEEIKTYAPYARQFLKEKYTSSDGRKRLAFNGGEDGNWYKYMNRWVELSEENIDQELKTYLQKNDNNKSTNRAIAEVRESLKDLDIAGLNVKKPCFLNRIDTQNHAHEVNPETVPNHIAFTNGVVIELKEYVRYKMDKKNGLNVEPNYKTEFNENFFSDNAVDYAWDENATCPKWIASLNYIMQGNQDNIKALQRMFGLILTEDTGYEVFFMLYGPEARNGKSQVLEALYAMVGLDNTASLSLEQLGQQFGAAKLLSAKVNISDEVTKSTKSIDGNITRMIKKIACGGREQFDRKNKEAVESNITARLIISCNVLPKFDERSSAMEERIRIIPFNLYIPKAKRIKKYFDNVLKPELPGILQWAIDGLVDLAELKKIDESYPECEEGEKLKKAYIESCDNELRFFNENYKRTSNQKDIISTAEMHFKYVEWSGDTKGVTKDINAFIVSIAQSAKLQKIRTKVKGIDGRTRQITVFTCVAEKTTEDWDKELGESEVELKPEFVVKNTEVVVKNTEVVQPVISDIIVPETSSVLKKQGDNMNAFDDNVVLDKNNVGDAEDIFGDGKTLNEVCGESNSSDSKDSKDSKNDMSWLDEEPEF